jgi:hypothetical protein
MPMEIYTIVNKQTGYKWNTYQLLDVLQYVGLKDYSIVCENTITGEVKTIQ